MVPNAPEIQHKYIHSMLPWQKQSQIVYFVHGFGKSIFNVELLLKNNPEYKLSPLPKSDFLYPSQTVFTAAFS